MTLSFIRVLFILMSVAVGYYVGTLSALKNPMLDPFGISMYGMAVGALSGLILIFIEMRLRHVSVRGLSSLVFGLLLGVFMSKLIADILSLLPLGDFILSVSRVVLTLVFSYLGAVMALRGKDEFNVIIPYVRFKRQDVREEVVLLDTSAIIDGRIGDIFKSNFLAGRLVVPRMVLRELQALADSADDIKRQRGRRGLELLNFMQTDSKIDIHIHEDDYDDEEEVDAKLVKLAKLMDASLCTTDFNLGKIATLQGVEVLNINDLVNAVRTAVYAGEEIRVHLLKAGKEQGQAVGYLEDGTMIVVSDAKDNIGKDVQALVTSILQTQAGKMVFAKIARD